MSELVTAARPYAKAAFAYALEQKGQDNASLSNWSKALDELAVAMKNPELLQFLTNPLVTVDKQVAMIFAVVTDLVPAVKNSVKVLADNKRLSLLPDIASLFEQYRAEAEKTVQIKVQSAFPLDAAQSQNLVAALTKKLDRKVELETETDPALIGGVMIRIGDLVIDGSVKGQLTKLANSLGS